MRLEHSFVCDIADLYKAETTLPLAFALHNSNNPEQEARRRFREDLQLLKLLPRIVRDVQSLLTPRSTDATDEDEPQEKRDIHLVHLWDPKSGTLPAGVNYAARGE
ncbi:hypothetical protein [Streptomyces californicus]|uniref:hypothetical protein n=1 Tax=Streptomyces californicus TaxID=67351 RepID=UPI001E3B5185|nr:hypothetical protein [Streptomyces californicus]MCC0575252.1 hypothetical protein [Streptomyces californicus]